MKAELKNHLFQTKVNWIWFINASRQFEKPGNIKTVFFKAYLFPPFLKWSSSHWVAESILFTYVNDCLK